MSALGLARPGRQLGHMGLLRARIAIYERKVQLVRDAGALAELPIHLHSLGTGKGVAR